jgi:hypothetical protein
MSNQIIEDAEKSINSYQAKTGTGKQSDSGKSLTILLPPFRD